MAGGPSGKGVMAKAKAQTATAEPGPEQVVLEEGTAGARPGTTFRSQPEVASVLAKLVGTPATRGPTRFLSGMQYVSIVLNKLGIRRILRLPGDARWLGDLVSEADRFLGARRAFDLTDAEMDAFVAAIRTFVVSRTQAFKAELALSRATARAMKGATAGRRGVVYTNVEVTGGVWTFFHTSGPDPVVLREAFTPAGVTAPGSAAPARPAFPGAGKPRWLGGSGKIYPTPPDVAAAPTTVITGIPVTLLRDAPAAIAEQLIRTEAARLARTRFPVTNTKAEVVGVVPDEAKGDGKTVTLGYGIERIKFQPPEGSGSAYDYKVTVEGKVRPSVPRPGDEEVLPTGGVLGLTDAIRLHLWGPILGDSTPAGLAYGPAELNRRQLDTIEGFLKTGKRGSSTGAKLRATAYIKSKLVRGEPRPFLQAAVYELTLEDGSSFTFELGIDAEGKVYGPVSRAP